MSSIINAGTMKKFASVMKAVRVMKFGGPEQLKVVCDVPIPRPTPTQVLVKVYAAGVNPVDTYIRSGIHEVKPALPYTPGWDMAGIIEDVGADVKSLKKGNRVYGTFSASGTYAQYAVAEASNTFALHDNLSFEQGSALAIPYLTAYRSLVHHCRARPGQSVLVHGASGAVGLACCQTARTLGLTVYGTAGTEDGLELIKNNGCHSAFSHHKEGYLDEIKDITGGNGVNLVLEMLANVNLENDLKIAAKRGHIAVIGSRGPIQMTPRLAMAKEVSIHGVMLLLWSEEEKEESVAFMAAGQEQGWVQPVVGKTYGLDDVQESHVQIITPSSGTCGKIILKIEHQSL